MTSVGDILCHRILQIIISLTKGISLGICWILNYSHPKVKSLYNFLRSGHRNILSSLIYALYSIDILSILLKQYHKVKRN